jgi:hypothetical protein
MEIPWQQLTVTFLAALIVYFSFQLAAWSIAPWHDIFTIFLVILSGIGFITSGIYYGEARAYRETLKLITQSKKEEIKTAV